MVKIPTFGRRHAFMEAIDQILASLIPLAEWAMLVMVVGGGLYLALYSRLRPYRYFRHAIGITAGKYDDPDDPGEVSHLQALSSAVAATVGLGNISGVAIAIYMGGPGVIFWIVAIVDAARYKSPAERMSEKTDADVRELMARLAEQKRQ